MAAVWLEPNDLAAFAQIDDAKALVMITDALALAARVAPCILDDSFAYEDAARAILRGAILRWHEAGSGAYQTQQQSTGPFSNSVTMDTRQQRRGMFWPSEITDLQDLCKGSETSGAFSVDTLGGWMAPAHADICSLRFGANYCSCGASLTGAFPLYEA